MACGPDRLPSVPPDTSTSRWVTLPAASTTGRSWLERGGSRTLARGLSVLRALGQRDEGATVAELSVATSLDRAVLYRLLETLCEMGFAVRDEGSRRYHLGWRWSSSAPEPDGDWRSAGWRPPACGP